MNNEEKKTQQVRDNLNWFLQNKDKPVDRNFSERYYKRPDLKEGYAKRDESLSDEHLQSMMDNDYAIRMRAKELEARGIQTHTGVKQESLLDTSHVRSNDELESLFA